MVRMVYRFLSNADTLHTDANGLRENLGGLTIADSNDNQDGGCCNQEPGSYIPSHRYFSISLTQPSRLSAPAKGPYTMAPVLSTTTVLGT